MSKKTETAIRVRTKIANRDEIVDHQTILTHLEARALIPGMIFAYIDGNHIVSFHEDTHPDLPDSQKARRVTIVK